MVNYGRIYTSMSSKAHEKIISTQAPYLMSLEALFRVLGATIQGLDDRQLRRARHTWGTNVLAAYRPVGWQNVFARQWKSPLTIALAIAALISFILHEPLDGIVIAAVIITNVFIGFTQEWKAEEAFRELSRLVLVSARVRRRKSVGDSVVHSLPSDQIVVGDVVLLTAGDVVPADGRLIEAKNFQVSEAALTGESLPIDKRACILRTPVGLADRLNMVFVGTHVTRGTATVLVTAVGAKTEFGHIAELTTATVDQRTPLQRELEKLSKTLALIFVELSLLLLFVGLLQQRGFGEMLRVAVAVSVAAIPEGLLVGMTVILVLGMKRLLTKGAYIRRLVATEALGAVTVICTDKTGTLTKGEMVVSHVAILGASWDIPSVPVNTPPPQWVVDMLNASILASHLQWVSGGMAQTLEPQGDSVEVSLARAAEQLRLSPRTLEALPRIDELPFDTQHKRMAVLRDTSTGPQLFVKGAPERVLSDCDALMENGISVSMSMDRRFECEQLLQSMLARGHRVLAVGRRSLRKRVRDALTSQDITGLTLLGFIAFEDPIRQDVPEAVHAARRAGVRTLMITGDHATTAKRAAVQTGIASSEVAVIDGPMLDRMNDGELRSFIRHDVVFARVEPRQKLRIVDALHANDELVAMIGDGINDAPALKSADVGVAVGSGSDVAKEVSDLVLLNDSFATFVAAIREGRVIVGNIRKVLLYLLADSFAELILIGAALLVGLPMPLLPLQILWINMVADGFPYLALTVEKEEAGTMDEPPRRKGEPLLNRDLKIIIIGMALVTNLGLFSLFAWFSTNGIDTAALQSIMFSALGVSSLFMVFACRSIRNPIWRTPLFSNPFLFVAVGLGIAMQVAAIHTPILQQVLQTVPLTVEDWILVVAIALVNLLVIEFFKGIVRWYPRREEHI